LFSRPGSKKLPGVIKRCLRACYLKSVVQDWAFQIGFLSEMCQVVFLPASAVLQFFLKIAGDFFRQTPNDSDLAN
jgi:hypothetical protein